MAATDSVREIPFRDLSKEEQDIVCWWVKLGLEVECRHGWASGRTYWYDNGDDDPRTYRLHIYRLVRPE
jgi:hypothetical protein